MHEMSLAMAVVEQVEQAAVAEGATGVEAVHLQVGQLAGVVAEALAFSFELACEGTVLQGAALVTEEIPGLARCRPCAQEWGVGMPPELTCPRCAGSEVELLAGRELLIRGVRWAGRPEPAPAGGAARVDQEG
ncbi:hydrogenase maturation nickel metallochaperone HypA [Kitasatospora sp. McL0602]|uniref:hydrogenase maturation nickel metallochaperone HypA n=1 Tax=Kitasatospora sp. McL0602 TaxID=3439530 RepID=UPI003F89E97E